jgi:hypothetical protein
MVKTYVSAAYCVKCDKYFKESYDPNETGYRDPEPCLVCGGKAKHKHVIKGSAQDPNIKEEIINICYGENPRYSASLGVSETQIEQARQLHPQAEWKKFGHSYRPLIKNRAEKLKMMRQAGYEEFGTEQFKGRG